MQTTTQVPHAPAQPLPALDDFLRPFHVHFARSEARHALERSLTGMLTEHPNKNCDTIAQVVPGTSEQSLQGLWSGFHRNSVLVMLAYSFLVQQEWAGRQRVSRRGRKRRPFSP